MSNGTSCVDTERRRAEIVTQPTRQQVGARNRPVLRLGRERVPRGPIPRYGARRMSAIDAIGEAATSTVFDVLVCMAWADRKLAEEEIAAARAVAIALGLPGGSELLDDAVQLGAQRLETLPLEALGPREAELTYLCAAWMALADLEEAPTERTLLEELRQRLRIAPARASWLHDRAQKLRKETPATVSFWREFDTLVVSAARALARGEAG